jgi:hypothetical protein
MRPILRTGIIAAAFAAVVVVAAVGWARKPALPAPYGAAGAGYAWDPNAGVPGTAPAGVPATPATYAEQQTGPYTVPYNDAAAGAPCAPPVQYEYTTPSYANRYGVRTVRQRVIVEERPQPFESRRVVRHGRSTGKSVAIVAGSAGVGAAIGALAGGGKGAAIGALAGGGGGFVYDRLTHNK